MNSAVLVGMFDTRAMAEQARTELLDAGFTPGQVTWQAESETGSTSSTVSTTGSAVPEKEGMFSHFFHSIFGSDDATTEHASTYQEAFKRGGFGLTVSASGDSEIDRATAILDDCGAFDVDERAEQWKSEGWASGSTASTGTASRATSSLAGTAASTLATDVGTGDSKMLSIVEESLSVGKRTVGRGGVRVFSRVVEVPVEETVRLREEQAEIRRTVVDRPATEADFAAFKEGSIEVRNSAEEAVIGKSARVVGEVEVGRKVTERDEVVRDTVRKTEVDVEQIVDAGTTAATSGTTGGTRSALPLSDIGTTGTGI